MGKQYISTVSASNAHDLDILGLEITNKYTITVSSDGYAKFWDNSQDELQDPNSLVKQYLIEKMGIHHVASYQNILPNSNIRIVILAFGCFDGTIRLKYYINDDLDSLQDVKCPELGSSTYWCPSFYKDPESRQDYFVVTRPSGNVSVLNLNISAAEEKISILLESHGNLGTEEMSFPNSLAVSKTSSKKVAVGYTNGDVLLYDLTTLKPIYTFPSTDLQSSTKSSSSIARALEFSPGGRLLAVSRDNQSAGSITLYDVDYGENVGSLTTASHSAKTAIGGFAHEGWIMGLSFNEEGNMLASGGFDKCVRIWDLDSREREATIQISVSDLENPNENDMDNSIVSGVKFIKKNIRGGLGGDKNDGICIISFDRGVRWYREAGGI